MEEIKFKKYIRNIFITIQLLAILSILLIKDLAGAGMSYLECGSLIFPLIALILYTPAYTFKDYLKAPYISNNDFKDRDTKIIKKTIRNRIFFILVIYFILLMAIIWGLTPKRIIDIKYITAILV